MTYVYNPNAGKFEVKDSLLEALEDAIEQMKALQLSAVLLSKQLYDLEQILKEL